MGLFSKLKPLKEEDKLALSSLENIISSKRIKLIKQLLKEKNVSLEMESIETSMAGAVEFPQIKAKADEIDANDVKRHVDYITKNHGGRGAVREVIELILKTQGKWKKLLEQVIAIKGYQVKKQ